eukprot:TRINITY_DN1727_c0_g1_i1.p1 TRINITY_DN1727_c0_g1~~TRINITY_DN1727_c0_g1_i1.p1  ORF type:complete len:398 (+),score=87.79 TRINITY_DN1727_c0_g1_i1:87-1196(+)
MRWKDQRELLLSLPKLASLNRGPRETGIVEQAAFVQEQVCVRLARSLQHFVVQPLDMQMDRFVQQAFHEKAIALESIAGSGTVSSVQKVDRFLSSLRENCSLRETIPCLARACRDLRDHSSTSDCELFVENIISHRIAIRALTEQLFALRDEELFALRDEEHAFANMSKSGIVDLELPIIDVALQIGSSVAEACEDVYGIKAEVNVEGDPHACVSCVPAHARYIVRELLKNAMRASLERRIEEHEGDKSNFAAVEVKAVKNVAGTVLTISDRGCGIPPSSVENIWKYGYSSVPAHDYSSKMLQIAGQGVGLPLARAYARHFGGDLKLCSTEHGTDAHVYFKAFTVEENSAMPRVASMPCSTSWPAQIAL